VKSIAKTGNVKILPEIPSITAEARRLKNQGVNILIALGHSGFDMDKQIAEQVDDIDLVIGGHTNTFLYNGEYQTYNIIYPCETHVFPPSPGP
jgi:5'-nucleotidase